MAIFGKAMSGSGTRKKEPTFGKTVDAHASKEANPGSQVDGHA